MRGHIKTLLMRGYNRILEREVIIEVHNDTI